MTELVLSPPAFVNLSRRYIGVLQSRWNFLLSDSGDAGPPHQARLSADYSCITLECTVHFLRHFNYNLSDKGHKDHDSYHCRVGNNAVDVVFSPFGAMFHPS